MQRSISEVSGEGNPMDKSTDSAYSQCGKYRNINKIFSFKLKASHNFLHNLLSINNKL